MNRRIFITAATGVFIILVISACGGSSSTSKKPSVSSTTVTPGAIPSLPPQPIRVGDRVALGVWQLRVVEAAIGETTVARIELTNKSNDRQDSPPASLYQLIDGTNSVPTVTAVVTEMPSRLKALETVTGTLTFTTPTVPKIPYLYWTGKMTGSLPSYIALDSSGEPTPSD